MSVLDYDRPKTRAAAPERSLMQRMEALERANSVRSHRKALKQHLKTGERTIYSVLQDPEVKVDTMKVFDLLLAMPKVGRVKANKLLAKARVSPSKTVGGLTERQRLELMLLLQRRGL